jgi:rhodanese-related sulfurtransferase
MIVDGIEAQTALAHKMCACWDLADNVGGKFCSLFQVGQEYLVGELAGGIDAWTDSGRPVSTIPLVEPTAMTGQVIDVRQANEYAAGHVPGALNIELGAVEDANITPGSVSLLALANDRAGAVEFVIDRALWDAVAVQAHPLINTATMVLVHADLERFLAATGHTPRVIDVPQAKASTS